MYSVSYATTCHPCHLPHWGRFRRFSQPVTFADSPRGCGSASLAEVLNWRPRFNAACASQGAAEISKIQSNLRQPWQTLSQMALASSTSALEFLDSHVQLWGQPRVVYGSGFQNPSTRRTGKCGSAPATHLRLFLVVLASEGE